MFFDLLFLHETTDKAPAPDSVDAPAQVRKPAKAKMSGIEEFLEATPASGENLKIAYTVSRTWLATQGYQPVAFDWWSQTADEPFANIIPISDNDTAPNAATVASAEFSQTGSAAAGAAGVAYMRIDVDLLINGAPVGSIPVEVSPDGREARVDTERLIQLVGPLLAPTIVDLIRDRSAGAPMVSVDALRSEDFPIAFDSQTLRLQIEIRGDAHRAQSLSVTGPRGRLPETITPPARAAFGLTVGITDRYLQGSDMEPEREPISGVLRGFANVGGVNGLYLAFDGGYHEDGSAYRRNATMFYDDAEDAIRWSAGDTDLRSLGNYHQPVDMLGFGVQRLYEVIQPYRNVRPSGRGALTLERPSRVEVIANGQVQRTLQLPAGRYDLRDFPFLDGFNDVRLVVEDEIGRSEALAVSFFSDTDLLDPGVSVFALGAGLPRDSFNQFDDTNYGTEVLYSGFYQRGVTNWLTLGVAAQADERHGLASMQAIVATPIGLFAAETAVDMENEESPEHSLLVSWKYRHTQPDGRQSGIDVDYEHMSDNFSPLDVATTVNPYLWEVDGRIQAYLVGGIYASLGAGYGEGRLAGTNETRYSANLSRSFEHFSVGASFDRRENDLQTDDRFTFSISMPFGTRQTVRSRYESDTNRVTAEWDRRAYNALNQTGARVTVSRSDSGTTANAELDHYSNRFQASARHDWSEDLSNEVRQSTDLSASFGIGYAGGAWAIGREADRGFVIVDPHRTLEDSQVHARSRYSFGDSAETGALGPSLVPIQRAYVIDAIQVQVDDLPPGYDIGAGRIDIVPGPGNGYRMEVGSAASNTVIGRLVNAAGEPVSFASGELRPLSGEEAETVQFFTNRTGRLVAQRVAPGRYAVVLSGRDTAIAEISVPEGAGGIVEINEIRLSGAP